MRDRTPDASRDGAPSVLPVAWEELADAVPVALSILDLEGRVLASNRAHKDLFGYGDGADLTLAAITHPDDHERTQEYRRDLLAGTVDEVRMRKRYVRTDGTAFVGELRSRALRDAHGVVVGTVGAVTDVSAEVDAHAAQAATERRLLKLLENVSDEVVAVDRDGRVVFGRRMGSYLTGRPDPDWLSAAMLSRVHEADRTRAQTSTDRVLTEPGASSTVEVRLHRSDGSLHPTELTVVNQLEDPDVGAIVVTFRDVTQARRTAAELARARDEALRASAAKSGFVAAVSHDLRTPLAAILGAADLLSTRLGNDAEARLLIEQTRLQVDALNQLLDDLLDLARIEAGQVTLDEVPVDLRRLVERTVATVIAAFDTAGLELETVVSPRVPAWVRGDEHRLVQVLTNLVTNAVKYTPTGRVTVAVDTLDALDTLEPSDPADPGRARVVLRVEDTGAGIEADRIPTLFEPFAAPRGSSRRGASTGLGLSIVRQLCEAMGGAVTVESEPGRGSAFTVVLPLAACAPPPDAPSARPAPIEPRSAARLGAQALTIMVVEDNPVNRYITRKQVAALGHHAVGVESGQDALDRMGPDIALVLMDLNMPGLDGIETTRRLRGAGCTAPVIGLSAAAMAADRAACLAAGMQEFVAKPAALADLGAAIDRWTAGGVTDVGADATAHGRRDGTTGRESDGSDEDVAAALATLTDELGDDVTRQVVGLFLDELPGRVARMEQALFDRDGTAFSRDAHTMASTSALVGGTALAALARRCEADGAATPPDRVAEVARVADRLADSLRTWLR